MSEPVVKICGIKTSDALQEVVLSGADMVGFVFHGASPRCISLSHAKALLNLIPSNSTTQSVALCVDPDDDFVKSVSSIGFDYLQLHGQESPDRVSEIKSIFKKPVIKALGIINHQDLIRADLYHDVDMFLLDAGSESSNNYGGRGHVFDWGLLSGHILKRKWLLSGGLNKDNVSKAMLTCKNMKNFVGVDVSSGVEAIRGIKDIDKIKNFIKETKKYQL